MSAARAHSAPQRERRRLRTSGGTSSVQYRRHERAAWLIVEADTHQGHRLHNAKTVCQAPSEHVAVASRQQEARTGEHGCGSDESFEVLVGLGDRVPEEADEGRVAGNAPMPLDEGRRAVRDRLAYLGAAVVTVDRIVQLGVRFAF
jgi:hypothetical protein